MPRFAKGPGQRATFAPRVGKVTRSIGIRGPEGGSIGTVKTTFSSRVLAENKLRISGTGEFIASPVSKSLFSEPGVQNTVSSTVFSNNAPILHSIDSPGRSPVSEQQKLSGIVRDSIRIIPQRPQPGNGRKFIQGLTDFKPLSAPVDERPVPADSVRNSEIFISPALPISKQSHSDTTPDNSQAVRRRFISLTIIDLAEQARLSSERNLGLLNTGNIPDNVGISAISGDAQRPDHGRYPVKDHPHVSPVDPLNSGISIEQKPVAVVLQKSNLYEQYGGSKENIPEHGLKTGETKSTVHDASSAKNILQLRQSKIASISSDSDSKYPQGKQIENTQDNLDFLTVKPVRIWKYIHNSWTQVYDGYWQLNGTGQSFIMFIRGIQRKLLPRPDNVVIGNTAFSDSDVQENKKMKDHSLGSLPLKTDKLTLLLNADQKLQEHPLLVSQVSASTHEHQTTEVVPVPAQGNKTVPQEFIVEGQTATMYQFPVSYPSDGEGQGAEGNKDQAAEILNPPKLLFVVDEEAGNSRVEQAAGGAALAQESPDGMVNGNDVAAASEKFTQQSKSSILRLFPLVDGSEVAFWSHISATGSLVREEWKKVANYYKKRFRPVAIKNNKGLSQEATATDLTLIFNGLSIKDVDLAA